MGRCIVPVSPHILAEAIGFPANVEVLHARWESHNFANPHVELIIESPYLPDVAEGDLLPRYEPTFSRLTERPMIVLCEWGEPRFFWWERKVG